MKKIGLCLLVLMVIFSTGTVVLAALPDFAGHWTNVDPNTRGITVLDIQVSGSTVTVQAWGKAHPTDIDWGQVEAIPYAPDVSSNLISNTQALVANYDNNFSKKFIIIRMLGRTRLIADVYTMFIDNSGRANYCSSFTFNRGIMAVPAGLVAPRQISPINGTVFSNFPRRTVLQWQMVPGAVSYTVEVDYSSGGSWLTDQGGSYLVVPNLKTTNYTFNFVGAQPGRWRVWAIGAKGDQSPKSSWWEFTYTH